MIKVKMIAEALKTVLEEMMPNYDIEISEVLKMNDQKLYGLTFKSDKDCAPTLYMEKCAEEYEAGVPLRAIAERVKDYVENVPDMPDDGSFIFEDAEGNMSLRMLDVRKNEEFLKQPIPYRTVDKDLPLVVIADIDSDEYRTIVNKSVLNEIGLSFNNAISAANANCMPKVTLVDMTEALFGSPRNILWDESADGMMFVLSNQDVCFGAASIAFLEVRKQIVNLLGEVYALPSSVHEWILLPAKSAPPVDELKHMVKTANETVVEPTAILSDSVFYIHEDGRLEEVA